MEDQIKYSGRFPIQIKYDDDTVYVGDDLDIRYMFTFSQDQDFGKCITEISAKLYEYNWHKNPYTTQEDRNWLVEFKKKHKASWKDQG